MKQRLELVMSIVILICACVLAKKSAVYVTGNQVREQSECIVIDVGHGGFDSGKIGVNGVLEKDINLQIALKLRDALKAEGMEVIMTREKDEGLYSANASNKKVQDLQNRCNMIDEHHPLLAVSIHQNSYPSPDVTGAQVFYYATSEEGKRLAETIQASLITNVNPDNRREAKANDSYYLLKNTAAPIVIVECGFLSSPGETELLTDEAYQDKLVEAIRMGIFEYLGQEAEMKTQETDTETQETNTETQETDTETQETDTEVQETVHIAG